MNQKKSWMILLAAALLLAASGFGLIFAAETTPGSAADPVVSKSYMDAQIEVLQTQINVLSAKVDQLDGAGGGRLARNGREEGKQGAGKGPHAGLEKEVGRQAKAGRLHLLQALQRQRQIALHDAQGGLLVAGPGRVLQEDAGAGFGMASGQALRAQPTSGATAGWNAGLADIWLA